jgi:CRP-like cAMP-binding protein
MYIVVSGALKIVTSLVDAADLTIDVVGPGEVVGEIAMLDGQPRSAGVVALVDTELIFIHRDVFTYFLHQDRKIADEVIRLLCDKVRSTTSYVETSVLLPLPLRLARWLITMARTQGKMLDLDVCEEENRKRTSGMALMMPLSHRDLAEAMGTSRESISRLMSHWQRHGIICTNRGRIVVLLDGALGKYLIDRSGTVQSLDIPS